MAAGEEKGEGGEGRVEASRMFYGNDAFYILFRLHHVLYERVLSAKRNARLMEDKWRSLHDEEPPDLYAKFLEVLYNLLDGSIDNSRFEDECRTAIGTQSYLLFTLDKVIFKLIKQLQVCATDDACDKLLQLHAYESSKGSAGFLDVVYHTNTAALLHEDNIYRFEHNGATYTPGAPPLPLLSTSTPPQVSVQLMEGGPEKLEVPPTAMESSFHDYLWHFLHSTAQQEEEEMAGEDGRRVFLTRNVRSGRSEEGSEEKGAAAASWFKDVTIRNGLECKISCVTSKVSYVLDTEDVLHRDKKRQRLEVGESQDKRKARRRQVASTRQKRFRMWMSKVKED